MTRSVVSLGAQNPAHPWWLVAERVIERLVGFHDPLLPGARVALVTPPDLQGARANPVEVATGVLDIGITTPSAAAHMARTGVGVYSDPAPGLRALAAFPHIDCIVFAVDARTGIESFEQLVEERYPLRLVTGRRSEPGNDDVLTYTVDEVLKAYGASYADLEAWGGEVIYGGPTHIGGKLLLEEDRADALFQEARTQPIWRAIADARQLNFLAVRDEVRAALRERLGLGEFTIEPGDYQGVTEPVDTIDFSGWLFFCREDLSDEIAHAVAVACDEIARNSDDLPTDVKRSLRMPIDPEYLFAETAIPLHPAVEEFARREATVA